MLPETTKTTKKYRINSETAAKYHEVSQGICMMFPKPKRRRRPETKDGRKKLKGQSYTNLRMEAFARSGGFCECHGILGGKPCKVRAPWPASGHAPMPWEGQLAHWPPKGMGNANGSDTLEMVFWLVGYHHDKVDKRNQKVCPPKPKLDELLGLSAEDVR